VMAITKLGQSGATYASAQILSVESVLSCLAS
jgi:hypothetical protein